MSWKNFLFSFRGRVGRAGFFLYGALAVPLYLLLAVLLWIYALSIPGAYENGGTPLPTGPLGIAGAFLFFLLLGVATLAGAAITVKRLHDRNKAWWWIAVFLIAPDLLFGWAQYLTDSETASTTTLVAVQFAALALTIWGFVELALLRGTPGANRFGPDPLSTA